MSTAADDADGADEPLIGSQRDAHAEESTLGDASPGLFIWVLTFSAGVSGLLFGYEYVNLSIYYSVWDGIAE
jgi:hypothetical protein